jgi:hypothetical protein
LKILLLQQVTIKISIQRFIYYLKMISLFVANKFINHIIITSHIKSFFIFRVIRSIRVLKVSNRTRIHTPKYSTYRNRTRIFGFVLSSDSVLKCPPLLATMHNCSLNGSNVALERKMCAWAISKYFGDQVSTQMV